MHPPWADDLDPKRASRRRTRRLGVWSPWSCGAWGKNNAEDWALQSALDLEYGRGGADCHPIQQAGACFEPYDLQFHASYTFNDYYIQNVSQQACDSGGSVALTSLNPADRRGMAHLPGRRRGRLGAWVRLTGFFCVLFSSGSQEEGCLP